MSHESQDIYRFYRKWSKGSDLITKDFVDFSCRSLWVQVDSWGKNGSGRLQREPRNAFASHEFSMSDQHNPQWSEVVHILMCYFKSFTPFPLFVV